MVVSESHWRANFPYALRDVSIYFVLLLTTTEKIKAEEQRQMK